MQSQISSRALDFTGIQEHLSILVIGNSKFRHLLNILHWLMEYEKKKKIQISYTKHEVCKDEYKMVMETYVGKSHTCNNCTKRHSRKSIIITKQKSFPAQAPQERYLEIKQLSARLRNLDELQLTSNPYTLHSSSYNFKFTIKILVREPCMAVVQLH